MGIYIYIYIYKGTFLINGHHFTIGSCDTNAVCDLILTFCREINFNSVIKLKITNHVR